MLCLLMPAGIRAQAGPQPPQRSQDAGRTEVGAPFLASYPDIPPAMRDLVNAAWRHYLEGSDLIKQGDSERARAAFDRAVDLILQGEWDVPATPVFQLFFMELIRRIHQDEALYLQPLIPAGEEQEDAVVDELSRLDLIPISIDPTLQHLVEADLANTRYDIPITLNEQVLQSLNYWLTKGRKYFADGLKRSGRYRPMIERIFREQSIPLDLMFLAQVESLFKTQALSRARARGIWQFGRWTAVRYGLKVDSYIDERSDPEKSTRAAALYLNDLYAMFKDWNLVLAAYNWGEGKVQRLIDRSGLYDFWDLAELKRQVPRETKNHVPLIQASIILAHNPEKYGLPTELEPPDSPHRVVVPHPIDLRSAAKILGVTLEELKQLNPALRGLSTPPKYADFELKVPEGSDPELHRRVASLPAVRIRPPAEAGSRYKVRPGDTLGSIAARYRISVSSLKDANGIRSPQSLKAGKWIRIPVVRSASRRPAISAKPAASKRIPSKISKSAANTAPTSKSKAVKSQASPAKTKTVPSSPKR